MPIVARLFSFLFAFLISIFLHIVGSTMSMLVLLVFGIYLFLFFARLPFEDGAPLERDKNFVSIFIS